MTGRTLLDKLWERHEITRDELAHRFSGSIAILCMRAPTMRFASWPRETCRWPGLTFGVVDRYAPTRQRSHIEDPAPKRMIEMLSDNTDRHGSCVSGWTTRVRALCMSLGRNRV